jgi:hypothetical protein
MMTFKWCGDAELQKQASWCLALLQPSRRHVDKLGEALDEIGKDQPPSLLAPYTGCPPGKAIIQSAIAAYEAREVERSILDDVGLATEFISTCYTTSKADEEILDSGLDTLRKLRAAEAALDKGLLKDVPGEMLSKLNECEASAKLLHVFAE